MSVGSRHGCEQGVSGAIGSIVFANLLPSILYETYAEGNACHGPYCFGATHAIIAFLCIIACAVALLVSSRSAALYTQIAESSARSTTDLV